MKINTVRLIGLGAVGCFIAPKLQKTLGDNFSVIAGRERADAIRRGVIINDERYIFPVAERGAADLIFIAVKWPYLDSAISDIKDCVRPGTIILPLLNGVDSEPRLMKALPQAHVLYSLVRVASMRENGKVSFDPAEGHIEFGELDNKKLSPQVKAVKELLDAAEIGYKVKEDMLLAIWQKFLINIGENLPLAMIGASYGALKDSKYMRALQFGGMREVVTVANALGIPLTKQDCEDAYKDTCTSVPTDKPSTLQDIESGRRTEIDMFSGELIRIAGGLDIPVPYNEVYYNAIHALEEKNAGKFDY